MDTSNKTKDLQDVDRCVKCHHHRKFFYLRDDFDPIARCWSEGEDGFCGCKCVFPSPSEDKNSVEGSKEHRAVPRTESQATSELDAAPSVTPRPITDSDLVAEANRNYDLGRKHGKGETLDERDVLLAALSQCRTLLSTLKHRDECDRWSLDAAIELTFDKVSAALALANRQVTNTSASDGTT